jgi:hypothetical protein
MRKRLRRKPKLGRKFFREPILRKRLEFSAKLRGSQLKKKDFVKD